MDHYPEVIDVWPAPGDVLNIVINSYGIRGSTITISANHPFRVLLRWHNNRFPWTWITCSVMIVDNNNVYVAN